MFMGLYDIFFLLVPFLSSSCIKGILLQIVLKKTLMIICKCLTWTQHKINAVQLSITTCVGMG